ncbi:MAG: hypothetical protein Q7U98_17155 [Methylicorpusculum sp.]|nr:hypothetical protein [Methylicorpusculum sp.]MDO8940885.1 hypothetical protein [Methylicorpusculum sp.]MDP2202424.1 hypothetical protein [Methylicorpusculum sp.]
MLEKLILALFRLFLVVMAAIIVPILIGWIGAEAIYQHLNKAEADHVRH